MWEQYVYNVDANVKSQIEAHHINLTVLQLLTVWRPSEPTELTAK